MTDTGLHFDTIIVGAGSAGCLLANRLSKNLNHRVLLIEAGGEDNWFWIKIPIGYLYTIANPRTDWCFKTEPDPGLNGRSINYPRGRVIGGSSSINAMLYMRGQINDYENWVKKTGDDIWSWKNSLETFKFLEDYFAGSNEWHGNKGEIRVEEPRVRWKILDAWQKAAKECGIPTIPEFNRGDNFGCAYFQVTQKKGVRWSMADAFLHPIRSRKNLTVMTHAQVLKILTRPIIDKTLNNQNLQKKAWNNSKSEAYGLEVLINNKSKITTTANEIILSAGAVSSPHLLQISGIGDSEYLKSLGINPIVHLKGVGENLQDHLQIRSIYKVSNCRTVNTLYKNFFTRVGMAAQYALFRTGPLTMPPSNLAAFAKSDNNQITANLEWHVQPLSLPKFGDNLDSYNAITPSVCNLRPTSRGWIKLTSSNPLEYPKIFCNYLSTEEDLKVTIAGLRKTREIMKSKSLEHFKPEEVLPGEKIQSENDLIDAARNLGTTIFHPVGTCAMGKVSENGNVEDQLTVLDSECRVRGISRLRVVDASSMPTITSGNTNTPVMLIAETVARQILQNH